MVKLWCRFGLQIASRAQKPSVASSEVTRYEEYDLKHGAKYIDPNASDDDW